MTASSIKKPGVWLTIIGAAVVVVLVLFILWYFGSREKSRQDAANPAGSANSNMAGVMLGANTPQADAMVGSEVKLSVQGRTAVMLAVDEKAFNELINGLSRRDSTIDQLTESGRVFTVPNDTRARVVEISSTKIKVRILEGDKTMAEGWVLDRWIH